jgi:hypothetical protein
VSRVVDRAIVGSVDRVVGIDRVALVLERGSGADGDWPIEEVAVLLNERDGLVEVVGNVDDDAVGQDWVCCRELSRDLDVGNSGEVGPSRPDTEPRAHVAKLLDIGARW